LNPDLIGIRIRSQAKILNEKIGNWRKPFDQKPSYMSSVTHTKEFRLFKHEISKFFLHLGVKFWPV
jgi:hypothetical protein